MIYKLCYNKDKYLGQDFILKLKLIKVNKNKIKRVLEIKLI